MHNPSLIVKDDTKSSNYVSQIKNDDNAYFQYTNCSFLVGGDLISHV